MKHKIVCSKCKTDKYILTGPGSIWRCQKCGTILMLEVKK